MIQYTIRVYEKLFVPSKEIQKIETKLNGKKEGLIEVVEYHSKYIMSKMEILSETQFKVYNQIESFTLNRKDYVLANLLSEMKKYPEYPLKILLEKNKTIDYFYENNTNFINDDKIFPKFLETEFFVDEIVNKKYIVSMPFYNNSIEGFTNKDFLVTAISGIPIRFHEYWRVDN